MSLVFSGFHLGHLELVVSFHFVYPTLVYMASKRKQQTQVSIFSFFFTMDKYKHFCVMKFHLQKSSRGVELDLEAEKSSDSEEEGPSRAKRKPEPVSPTCYHFNYFSLNPLMQYMMLILLQKKSSTTPPSLKIMTEWSNNPEFKGVLVLRNDHETGKKTSFCAVCNKHIQLTNLNDMRKHCQGKKHKDFLLLNSKQEKERKAMEQFLDKSQKEKVSGIETRLCMFIAENDLSLRVSDRLVPLVKAISNDKTLEQVTLGRQKAGNIIRDGELSKSFLR